MSERPTYCAPSEGLTERGTPTDFDYDQALESLQVEVARLREQFVACHQMASLGTLAALVAHELNNLMTPILSWTQFAAQSDDPALMRKALQRSATSAQRVLEVAQRLIGMAQNKEKPAEPRSVAAAAREAVEMITRPLDKDGIALRLEVPEDLRVVARPGLFEQVLLNLLLNAREAMRDCRGVLSVGARLEGEDVVVEVCDCGKGFSETFLRERLNPFLSPEHENGPLDWQEIGLGFEFCRTIAEQHGARIEAVSHGAEAGTTMRVRWPRG